MDPDPLEPIVAAPAKAGESVKLSAKTLDALDRLRIFYRNNRGQEISRDDAVLFAATTTIAYGQMITRTADGRGQKVRG